MIKVARRNDLVRRNAWKDDDTSHARKITIAMKDEKSHVKGSARDHVLVIGKELFHIYSCNSYLFIIYRDRSERKRDKRDRSRSRGEKRRDKDKKERKPEFDIKIKEEPVDGEFKSLLLIKLSKIPRKNYLLNALRSIDEINLQEKGLKSQD